MSIQAYKTKRSGRKSIEAYARLHADFLYLSAKLVTSNSLELFTSVVLYYDPEAKDIYLGFCMNRIPDAKTLISKSGNSRLVGVKGFRNQFNIGGNHKYTLSPHFDAGILPVGKLFKLQECSE